MNISNGLPVSLQAEFEDPEQCNTIPIVEHARWLKGQDAEHVNGYAHKTPYTRVNLAGVFQHLSPVVEVFEEATEQAVLKALSARLQIDFVQGDVRIHFTQDGLPKPGESYDAYIFALPYSAVYQGCATLRIYNPGKYIQAEIVRDETGKLLPKA